MSDLTGEKATEPMTSGRVSYAFPCIISSPMNEYHTEHGGQRLGGIEKLGGRDCIALISVDGNIDKRPPKRLNDGATGGDNRGRHDEAVVCSEMT